MGKNGSYSEKDLDQILDKGFINSSSFAKWFLSKTRFSKLNATYKWSRSDHPWGRVPLEVINPLTGENETVIRESETDVLVVFETEDNRSIALHIENKLADGTYTQYQPELYGERAKLWLNTEKYSNYSDFETVLVAPIEFYANNFKESQCFDKFISYEEIAILLPEFADYLKNYKAK